MLFDSDNSAEINGSGYFDNQAFGRSPSIQFLVTASLTGLLVYVSKRDIDVCGTDARMKRQTMKRYGSIIRFDDDCVSSITSLRQSASLKKTCKPRLQKAEDKERKFHCFMNDGRIAVQVGRLF